MALSDNLISWWKLDEASGTRDDAKSTNDLADNNTVAAAAAKINDGADFETANSEWLGITDGSQSGLDITSDMSWSGWINLESLTANQCIFSKWHVTSDQRAYAFFITSGGLVRAFISSDGTNAGTSKITISTTAMSTATWYHVVITYDASAGEVKLYLNGSLDLTTTGHNTSIFNSSAPFNLGGDNSPIDFNYFDGIQDEVGIWNRVLDSTEVTSLYNSGNALTYPFSTNHTKTLTDTVTATDTFSRVWTIARTYTEAATAAASIIKTLTRTLVEAITATDTVTNAQPQIAGPNSPGTTSDDSGTGTLAWSNTSNVTASDDSYATRVTAVGGTTHYLIASNFGFSIPSGATIDGILLEIERKRTSNGTIFDARVRLVKGGVVGSADKSSGVNWSIFEAYFSYGGSSDLWSDTWTPDDINASNFGAALSVTLTPDVSITASVDHIRITIHYTLSGNLYTETYTEAVTAADTALKTAARLLSEAATATADFTRVWTASTTLTEAATAADALIKTSTRTLSEAVTAATDFIRSVSRDLAESITATSTLETVRGLYATFTEAIAAADTLIKTATRVLVETAQAVDSLLREMIRTLSDTATATDTFIGSAFRSVTFSEAATAAGVLIKTTGRTITDAATATATHIKTVARNLSDTSQAIDTIVRVTARAITDTATATDTILKMGARTLSETATAADYIIKTVTRALAEAISGADTLIRHTGRAIVESVTNSDVLSKSLGRALSEAITSQDIFSKVHTLARTFTEQVSAVASFVGYILTKMKKGIAALRTKQDTTVLQSKHDVLPLRSTDDTTIL